MFKNLDSTIDRIKEEEIKSKSKFIKDYRANMMWLVNYITKTKKEYIREVYVKGTYIKDIYCKIVEIEVPPELIELFSEAYDHKLIDGVLEKEVNKMLADTGVRLFHYNKRKIALTYEEDEIRKMIDREYEVRFEMGWHNKKLLYGIVVVLVPVVYFITKIFG